MNKNIYKEALEYSPTGYAYHELVYDKNGQVCDYIFLEANEAFEKFTGLKRDEIIGKKVTEAIPTITEDEFDWIAFYGKLTQNNEIKTFKQYSSALQRTYDVHAYSPKKEHFITLFSKASTNEETDVKEDKIHDTSSKVSPTGIIVLDKDLSLVEVNNKTCEILGYTHEELFTIDHKNIFIGGSDIQRETDIFNEIVSKMDHKEHELKIRTKNGEERWISLFVVSLEENRYMIFISNITEEKNDKNELQKTKILFESSLSNPLDTIICSLDTDYNFLYFNQNYHDMTLQQSGIDIEIGMNLLDIIIYEDDKIKVKKNYDRAFNEGAYLQIQNYMSIDDIFYETYYSPIYDAAGKLLGATAFSRDVTEQIHEEQKLKQSEAQFHSLFNNMISGAVIYEVKNNGETAQDYIIKDFNPTAFDSDKLNEKEIRGKSIDQIRPNIEEFGLIDIFKEVWQTGEPAFYPPTYYEDDEVSAWFINRVFKLDSGEIVAIFDDITDMMVMQEELQASEENLRILLDSAGQGIYGIDLNDNCTFVNKGCVEMLGYQSQEQLIGENMHALTHYNYPDGSHYPFEDCPIIRAFEGNYVHADDEYLFRLDGSCFPIEYYAYPKYHNNKIVGAVVSFSDITERRSKEAEISYLSYHDILTGLYNRTYFEKEKIKLDKKRFLPLSYIIGDINGLKMVNDALGYTHGDEQIIQTANILHSCLRKRDVLARIGGDEFAILLPKTDFDGAHRIMQKIQKACDKYNDKDTKEPYYINISLGCATKDNERKNINDVIKAAEDNMFRRKLLEGSSLHSKIVSSMVATMIERSQETKEHAQRMAVMTKKIAAHMGLSEDEQNKLELLATLHDIGKISIERSILQKPDKLTQSEWEEMRKHPESGYRIAMATPELKPIADYILTHHERWDGKGYPNGLSKNKIPLLSRIISIVDAYDAMTEDRIYRKALSKEEAIQEIKDNAGTQFDPKIAKLFIRLITEQA